VQTFRRWSACNCPCIFVTRFCDGIEGQLGEEALLTTFAFSDMDMMGACRTPSRWPGREKSWMGYGGGAGVATSTALLASLHNTVST
jgi:hypothetical protein